MTSRQQALFDVSGGEVLVGISGKDSLVVLDQLSLAGFKIVGYHLYVVPGLSFRERYLLGLERRYKISIIRWPHPDLAHLMRQGVYRHPLPNFPALSFNEVFDALRWEVGVEWIATGEKMVDSLQRRGMMKRHAPDYLEKNRRVAWPIADWNDRQVRAYLRQRRLPLPPEYGAVGRGWGGSPLEREGLRWLHERHPQDFRRYRLFFPAVEAGLYQQ